MTTAWELATFNEISAYYFTTHFSHGPDTPPPPSDEKYLIIIAKGEKPNPNYTVRISQVFTDAESPLKFEVQWLKPPGISTQPIDKYECATVVILQEKPEFVFVSQKDGEKKVEVKLIEFSDGAVDHPLADSFWAISEDVSREVVGHSKNYILQDAFLDALKNIPPASNINYVELVKIWAMNGGIGGHATNGIYIQLKVLL